MAAAEVAGRILGVDVERAADSHEMSLVYPDGHRAAFEVAALGEGEELVLGHPPGDTDMHWTAPACWWWQVGVNDVRRLRRVREIFPVVARVCEAHGVPSPRHLPAPLISAVPDLHWLVHTDPAQLLGHPDSRDHPATVTLRPGSAADQAMSSVVPALRDALAGGPAARALRAVQRRRAAGECQLYLTVGCTGLAPEAFESLVRADGVPPVPPPDGYRLSHLWLAPILGHAVFLWTHDRGWSRHGPAVPTPG